MAEDPDRASETEHPAHPCLRQAERAFYKELASSLDNVEKHSPVSVALALALVLRGSL